MYQRMNRRLAVHLRGTFRGEVPAGEGTVLNLSRAGCAFHTDRILQIGTCLEVEIHLPGADSPVHVKAAVVRWTQDHQFGLEFIRITPEEQRRLRRFVRTPNWMRRLKNLLGIERI